MGGVWSRGVEDNGTLSSLMLEYDGGKLPKGKAFIATALRIVP
jgi:hypothetical protein